MINTFKSKRFVLRCGGILGFLLCGMLSVTAGDIAMLKVQKSTDLDVWNNVDITSDMLDKYGHIVLKPTSDTEFYRLEISFSPEEIAPITGDNLSASAPLTSAIPKDGARLQLQKSTSLETWTNVSITSNILDEQGRIWLKPASDDESYRLEITLPLSPMLLVAGGNMPESSTFRDLVVAPFYISRTEVTWGEWLEVRTWAAANGYDIGTRGIGCAENHPVHSISWFDALKWCNAKTEMENEINNTVMDTVYTIDGVTYRSGEPDHKRVSQSLWANGYRLPQEVEWEFAARGGIKSTDTTYAGSNDLDLVGWYSGNSSGAACIIFSNLGTWPVAQKIPNELGLYDMSGNVWEWCFDRRENHTENRYIRGGGFSFGPNPCRVSSRTVTLPTARDYDVGIRLVRTFD